MASAGAGEPRRPEDDRSYDFALSNCCARAAALGRTRGKPRNCGRSTRAATAWRRRRPRCPRGPTSAASRFGCQPRLIPSRRPTAWASTCCRCGAPRPGPSARSCGRAGEVAFLPRPFRPRTSPFQAPNPCFSCLVGRICKMPANYVSFLYEAAPRAGLGVRTVVRRTSGGAPCSGRETPPAGAPALRRGWRVSAAAARRRGPRRRHRGHNRRDLEYGAGWA